MKISPFSGMILSFCFACNTPATRPVNSLAVDSTAVDTTAIMEKAPLKEPIVYNGNNTIETSSTDPGQLLRFAETLVGTPYLYGSIDPGKGFDCSGFITYVFNHFNVAVPRSSADFTNIQMEIPLSVARPGDLVLFTGTDSTIRTVGHMGIIHKVDGGYIDFIHSSSGKANGVTITPLNHYYMTRFVKIIRIFPG